MGSQHGDERSFAYFNLPSGPWTTGPDPGDTGHDGGALLASGGYIYAIGGYTYGPSVERYDPRKILELNTPALGVAVSGTVHILGSADRTDFDSYRLEIKASSAPDSAYATIHESDTPILFDTLAIWDSTSVPDGQYTLRLTMKASVASGSLQDSITKGFIVRQAN
jgi:hypothetical protein